MRYTIIVTGMLLMMGSFSACNKMLDTTSHRAVTEENMWQNKNDARAAVSGCYTLMRAAMINENAHWAYGEVRGGDFKVTSRGDLQALADNNLNANYSTMDQWRDWRRFYAAIDMCNLTIARLPEVPDRDYRYSVNDMKLDRAQAMFIRAFMYYYIVRIWGDVPLITTPADGTFKPAPRENWRKVLDFAAQEALASVEGLPWDYRKQSPELQGQYRGQDGGHHMSIAATKGMAYTLLAHIYAWKEEYQQALTYADIVIDNKSLGYYDFVKIEDLTRLDGSFRGRGWSNIFQVDLNFDHGEIATTGELEDWTLREPDIPKRESEIYVSKDTILSLYNEPHDVRPAYFFARMNEAYPEFYKVKQLNNAVTNPSPTLRIYSSCVIVFRWEELYLLRSECRARLGIAGATDDINAVRNIRSLKNIKPTLVQGQALIDTIFMERRRELIGEGWYWYDLVHFKKIPKYTTLKQADVDRGAAFWPLSKDALTNNKALVQNPYWQ